jgi:hypothetical protein
MQSLITLHGSCAINARLDYSNAIEQSLIAFGMGCQGFDDEPLIGIGFSHSGPDHAHPLICPLD